MRRVLLAVGILVVLGFIAMMAAISLPGLLSSPDRSQQKRTMADLRTIGAGMEKFADDHDGYPGPTDGWVPLSTLQGELTPKYIRRLPVLDGWGHPFLVNSTGEEYSIASPAGDGAVESARGSGGPTQDVDCDIVFGNGSFVQWPDGLPAN